MIKNKSISLPSAICAFRQNKESGEVILFLHGNSSSSLIFQNQFNDESFKKYRLIALDLPGHGASGPAKNPQGTYSIPGFAAAVCEFMDELSLSDVILVGHSLGGHVALEVGERDARVKAIMTIGASPIPHDPSALERIFPPSPLLPIAFKGDLSDEEKEVFVAAAYNGGEMPPFGINDISRGDGSFRSHFGASIAAGIYADEAKFVANSSIPIAVVYGAEEKLLNVDFLKELTFKNLWRDEALIVAGGHAPFWSAPEDFNRVLLDFLDKA